MSSAGNHPVEQPQPAQLDVRDNLAHAIEAGWTRVRITDDAGETVGIVWTYERDDEYLRALIPDGFRAMVRRGHT